MTDFDAAIFDLDGTLIDSMGMWEQLDADFLARRGLAVPEGYTEAVSSMNFPEAAAYTVRRLGLPESPEEIVREWNSMVAEEYAHGIGLKPHAREYLEFLRDRGIRLGVATALPPELYGPVLKNNGVFPLFAAFADVSEVARGKGFPDVYLLAAERLGVPPCRCAVFEDVLPGVRGAKAAGMTVFGVRDRSSARDEAAIRETADGFLRDFAELLPKGYPPAAHTVR